MQNYFEEERLKLAANPLRGDQNALELLAGLISRKEFLQMAEEVAQGLREIRVEDGFVHTCLTPKP